jgi:hypothetical protein
MHGNMIVELYLFYKESLYTMCDTIYFGTCRKQQISNRQILRTTMFVNMPRTHLGYTTVFTLIGSITILPAA